MVIIRRLERYDWKLLEEFFLSLSDETLTWQNHFGKVNIEPNAQVVAQHEVDRVHSQQLSFLAIANEETIDPEKYLVAGYGWLTFGMKEESRYTCSLALVVADEFQHRGIGTYLCEKMILEAGDLGLRKLFLNVYSKNHRAVKLYEKLGFHVEGVFKKQEWSQDNVPLDLYSMALFL